MTKLATTIICVVFFFSVQFVYAQCSLVDVPFAKRINGSDLIVEGMVTAKESYWDKNHRMIYTCNTIEVYKIFKGTLTTTNINIITEGGIVGSDRIDVEPGLHLNIGDIGMFTSITNSYPAPNFQINNYPSFNAYATIQGFIQYDPISQKATDIVHTYSDINTEVYDVIQAQTQQAFIPVKSFNLSSFLNPSSNFKTIGSNQILSTPTITGFSPTTITAGTFSQLTINGSGFGATRGASVVGFKNADNAGQTYINPAAIEYISWSDNQIIVLVPTKAGTGTIRVTNGGTATSSSVLTIPFAEYNQRDYSSPISFFNENGNGGYTWHLNSVIDANAAAKASFTRALNSWRCNTGINWTIGAPTSSDTPGMDGENIVSFANPNNPLTSGIAVCYMYYSSCMNGNSIIWHMKENDIIFQTGVDSQWWYDITIPSAQADFETIGLHELGHAHGLGHVISNGSVMHYIGGPANRSLGPNDIDAGSDFISRSIIADGCGNNAMVAYNCNGASGNLPIAGFTSNKTEVCMGGTINFTDQSTNSPTSWAWSFPGSNNGSINQNATAFYGVAGKYHVSLTVANASGTNTKAIDNYITVNSIPYSVSSGINVQCNGAGNGSASVNVTHGTSPFTYLWSNGATTPTINNLTPGNYSYTVTDSKGCTFNAYVPITQPTSGCGPALPVAGFSSNKTDVCTGGTVNFADQSMGATSWSWSFPGGNPYFSFSQNPTITYSNPGIYDVSLTATNSTGSNIKKIVGHIVVNAPVIEVTSANISCAGTTGSASVVAGAGTTPYTYLWSNGNTGTILNNLSSGSYICTVTDNKGCSVTSYAFIGQAPPLYITLTPTHVTTCGGNQGSVSSSIYGGVTPYTYLWSNGQTTPTITTLTAGAYVLTVTDNKGCTKVSSVVVNNGACSGATPVSNFASNKTQVCVAGTVSFTDQSTNTPSSWSWSFTGGTPSSSSLQHPIITYSTPGTYNVSLTATNANGSNTKTMIGYIVVNANPTSSTSVTNVSCNGTATGSISLSNSGGTSPYAITWSNGKTTATINNLIAGTYNATITDSKGCNVLTTNLITQPSAINITLTPTHVSTCNGNQGSISTSVSGGLSPYVYLWSTGQTTSNRSSLTAGTYVLTVTDSKGCTKTNASTINNGTCSGGSAPLANFSSNKTQVCAGSTISFTDQSTGSPTSWLWSFPGGTPSSSTAQHPIVTYNSSGIQNVSLTVTNSNGTNNKIISSYITVNAIPSGSAIVWNVSCNGGSNGSAFFSVNSGTSPYTYSWNNGGVTPKINYLVSSTYVCTVTDAKGCTATIATNVTQPAVISITLTPTSPTNCGGNQGAISSSIAGGTSPYTYSWNTGHASSARSGLTAGTYSLVVTDSKGCTTSTSVNVASGCSTVSPVSNFSANKTQVCAGGSVNFSDMSSGSATSWLWTFSGGTPSSSTLQNPTVSYNTSGTYNVSLTATNSNGSNTKTMTGYIVVNSNPTSTASVTNVSCNSTSTGSIALTNSGGVSPYLIIWSNGQTTSSISNLSVGSYNATVTDSKGCKVTTVNTVTQPSAINVALTPTHVITCDGNQGTISTSVSGGASPYTYVWNNGQTSANRSGLITGTYSLTTTDAKGCLSMASVKINNGTCSNSDKPQLTPTYCGATVSATQLVYCTPVSGASHYEFKIYNYTLGYFAKKQTWAGFTSIELNWYVGLLPNTTYNVEVRAYVNGSWTDYGPVCAITIKSNSAISINNYNNSEKINGDIIKTMAISNFNFYPNPVLVNSVLHFDLTQINELLGDCKLRIVNILGEDMVCRVLTSNREQVIIDSEFKSGTYFVEIEVDNSKTIKLLIIQ